MPSGGARNRSGPPLDPHSGRSDARGVVLTALPNEGYGGEAPVFPLPAREIRRWEFEDKRKYQVPDDAETERVAGREIGVWEWIWRTPQACAWAIQPWRTLTIAMWVRTFVICESDDATAADKNALHRFADQIGLTPAGLKENGWAIAADEVAAKATRTPEPDEDDEDEPPRRLSAVNGDK